jgi:hypothetical protein
MNPRRGRNSNMRNKKVKGRDDKQERKREGECNGKKAKI